MTDYSYQHFPEVDFSLNAKQQLHTSIVMLGKIHYVNISSDMRTNFYKYLLKY